MSHSETSRGGLVDGDSIAAAVLNALDALANPDRWERARVIEEAAQSADPDALVRAVGDQDDAIRRNAAMDALVRGGRRSVPALVRALDDPDPEVVMFAANLLGKTRDRSAIPHLLRLLRYEDTNIVQAAIESLGFLRAPIAVEPLLELLEGDPWLRFGAIFALGEIGDARAIDPLAAALADPDSWEFAVAALGKIRSPRAIAHLADAVWTTVMSPALPIAVRGLGEALRRLPAPDPLWDLPAWTRLASAEAAHVHAQLGRFLDPDDGSDKDVAEAAATLIRMLRVEALYPPLVRAGRSTELRAAAQFCTLALGARAVAAVALGLRDADEAVREFACRCAGALRSTELAAALVERLEDPSDQVREAAVRALEQHRTRVAATSLAGRLLDPSPAVRAAAQEALGTCDPSAASEALLAFPERNASVMVAMLRVMRASPHAEQLPFLLDCLHHEDVQIRALSIDAIAEQPELDLVGMLEPMLGDDDETVRATALRAIGRHRTARAKEVLVDRLCRDPISAPLILDLLVAMEGRAIASRLLELYPACPAGAQLLVLDALASLREPAALPLIIARLAAPDPETRGRAVRAAARFDDPIARHHVIAAGTDPAWEVRAAVAEILAAADHPGATDELERLALDDHPLVATTARHRLEAEPAA
ncbi:MAG: HEAT repeat domain-containing protein [Deltaproteobacteria bacterium]|nr:HEAT repeat domain-containing protein [Deltaproteobacteria bacterium]